MANGWKDIKSNVKNYISLCKDLLEDKRTPRVSKLILGLAVGYLVMPFDLIPDFIPVVGQLDDILIVPGLLYLAFKYIPKDVFDEHRKKIFGNV